MTNVIILPVYSYNIINIQTYTINYNFYLIEVMHDYYYKLTDNSEDMQLY